MVVMGFPLLFFVRIPKLMTIPYLAGPLWGVEGMKLYMAIIMVIHFPHSLLIGPANQSCIEYSIWKISKVSDPYGSEISPQSRLELKSWHRRTYLKQPPKGKIMGDS